MSPAAERLKGLLQQLSSSDRAGLAHFLIRTLDGPPGSEASDEDLDTRLQRRLDEMLRGDDVSIPVDEALAELRARYRSPTL